MPDGNRKTYRISPAWVVAWVLLTVSGVLIHAASWVPPDALKAGLSPLAEFGMLKRIANAIDTVVGPIWLALALITGDWGVFSVVQSVFAHGLAAGALLLGWRAVIRARKRAFQGRTPSGPSVSRDTSINLGRRKLLTDAPLAAAALLGGAAIIDGAFVEPFDIRLRRYTIPINDLPDRLSGLRAVFLADTHLGPRVPREYLARVIAQTLSLRPDIVLLGGDYVHSGSRYIRPAVELLKPIIDAGIPTVGVLGNHDWYNSRGLVSRHLTDLGVRMVDNAHVLLDAKTRHFAQGSLPPSEALCIAGVGDLLTDSVDIRSALEAVPDHVPRLVLSHNPDAAELASMRAGIGRTPPRVDLMLSGHMHGGQIALPLIGPLYVPSRWGRKYAGGLATGPAFPVLVSRGVGMSICPVRIGVPPELLEITLVSAPRRA